MLYAQIPTRPLKEFTKDLLRNRTIILCSDGILALSDVYRTFVDGGYGNTTVKELKQVLKEIERDNRV